MFRNAVELAQSSFGVAPERLDPVDVRPVVGEFVVAVLDAQVLGVAHVHEPIVAGPAIGMDDAVEADASVNRFAQSVFRHIRDDLGVDTVAPLEHPEDDGLVRRVASPLATDPS